jgi:hypothetical protein
MRLNTHLQRLRLTEASINRHLFLVCAGVTIVAMVTILLEFFTRGAFPPSGMHLFYLGVLVIYSFHKELVRWLGERKVERQGEYFVYSWIGLTTILYLINFLSKDYFTLSATGDHLTTLKEVSVLTLEVLGVFILTRILKLLRVMLTRKKIFNQLK